MIDKIFIKLFNNEIYNDISLLIFKYYTDKCNLCNNKQEYCKECELYCCQCELKMKKCSQCKILICCQDNIYKICDCCESYLCNNCVDDDDY
jgi:hypothetical protein